MRLRRWFPAASLLTLFLVLPVLPASAGIGEWTRGNQPGGTVEAAALSGATGVASTPAEGLWRSTDTCRHWALVTGLSHVNVRGRPLAEQAPEAQPLLHHVLP